jgi:glycosyltransferase involved in cell wall biosynthesis
MLSVIIITKNESLHIRRCLESVSWADEIIVYDSGSEDDTVSICKEFTPNVFVTDWPGFGLQKQRALDKASHDWVLSIDADEEISASLKQEIKTVIKNTTADGFDIPRLSSYCGRQIKHGSWWPDYVLRLFRRNSAKFSNDIVHERILITGITKKLQNPIFHESYINHEEVITKLNSYSSLGAEKLYLSGKQSTLYGAIGRSFWTFLRDYLFRFGIFDGEEGLMLAISNAETTYYKYLKLRYLKKQTK